MALVFFIALLTVAQGQHLKHYRHNVSNNSYVYSRDIHIRGGALNCVSGGQNPSLGSWKYPNGRPVPNEQDWVDGDCFFYRKNGERVIGLYRVRLCNGVIKQGLWSCVAPDSSGEMQTLYVYIGDKRIHDPPGKLQLVDDSMYNNFTLHNTSVPEFTTSCRTHGGPATTVQWTVNGSRVQEDRYHETSQLILDTSLNSVYDNRLRVRGRRSGTYECSISNNIRHYLPYFVKEDEVKVSKTITVTDQMLEGTVETLRESLTQNSPPKLMRDDSTTNIEHDVSVKYHTSSPSCQDKEDREEDGDSTAVIAGCVGGAIFLIIVTQSLAIILLLLRQRAYINRARVSGKKLGTCSKSTIGVDPEHEMMGLQKVGAQQ